MKIIHWYGIAALVLLLFASPAFAELGSSGIMNDVLNRFHSAASDWAGAIENAASRLFWTLVLISMVITFGFMALQKADIGDFFAELVRFTLFTGFFWWLLTNAVSGWNIGGTIMDSLQMLGAEAGGLSTTNLGPSSVVDLGFELYDRTVKATDELSWREMGTQIVMMLMALGVLIVLALVAVNMLLLLAASWILLYAGVFFLGFGGSRWTSDIAINYFKTVLGVAAQLLSMVLIVAIGKQFLTHYYSQINETMATQELAVMLVVAVILLFLVNKVPPLISGIITGAGIGAGAGIGNFGASAMGGAVGGAIGATSAMVASAQVAGNAVKSTAAGAAEGMSELKAAFTQANSDSAAGSDILANPFSDGGDNNGPGGGTDPGSSQGSSGSYETPFSKAAGYSEHASGGSASSTSSESQGEQAPSDNSQTSTEDEGQTHGAESTSAFDGNSLASTDETEVDEAEEIAAFAGTDTEKS
ncbi:MAG: P-type conjugative transfer protein TrbL [Candidatus Thiodiazotropha weberae]|nr:P-type conjugative transfer protein TrbL [Candidatus Thiodiazotropha lotti]MCG8011415.1 P-type conjugative transfer protein TrbL [Candidatus Thiodiazotropha lotti]MCG8020903.1 P-type conjugative transfer protein TrbL [Candidatus Thiodiazotropha lotti]MCW4208069.1 P-type conjugative transfer protein TrbL [Candidatus Thiodiazotropha lotti]MCW4210880.1 P-type conjugative transfer protein TrbL [Candidatus Thiodiazotropha lotti]